MPHYNGYKVLQDLSEFDQFCKVLVDKKVRSYLEIGCWTGGTIRMIAEKVLPKRSRIVAIDKHFKPTKEIILKQALAELNRKGFDTHMLSGDSADPKIIEAARKLGPYDAVFIDGDHRLEYVKKDWDNYGSMGSIVGFHDIARDLPEDEHGGPHQVATFWQGFKNGHKHAEFISESSRAGLKKGAFGIGVVWRQ